MVTVSQSGVYNLQSLTSVGALGVGMRLYTYTAGTTTHKTAYTDSAGAVAHTYTSDGSGGQYIAMDARGELPAPLYLTSGAYDLALKTAAGATVWTRRADPTGADLAASGGSALIGYQPASGSATTAETHLRSIDAELDLVVHKTADTGAAIVPIGTTAERPGTPVAGHFRRNTTTGSFEGYDGSNWTEFGGVNSYINIRDYQALVSGGSWTAAFNQALVDAAASKTRTIYFPYDVTDNNGNYDFNTKPNVMGIGITLVGENSRQFLVRNYAPSGTAATAASSFLVWDGSGYVSDPNQNKGGGMVNIGVGAGNGTTLGTAILVTGTNTDSRPGYMDFRNVVISVPNGSTGTWQHGFFIQGQSVTTSGSQGMRDIFAHALYVFRCTDEPFRITNGVHISIHGLTISDGGAGNPNPTVRVNGAGSATSNSTQCFLNNLDIEGTLALTECSYVVAMGYANVISTTLTATKCKFIGIVNTNNSTTGTTVI